jgi:threonine/homoserine/homoserine lactone efflux protein
MPAALAALVLGALAGLAVAMPVGPVGVLLLRTGLLQGIRVAVGAAAGIATVDAGYAVLAVVAGTPVSRVAAAHTDAARVLSGTVLLAVGVATLSAWWRARPTPTATALADETNIPDDVGPSIDRDVRLGTDVSPSDPGSEAVAPRGRRAWRAYGRFVGLTAVNPLTAVTFATVAVGLAVRAGDGATGAGGAAAFVVGAGVASLAWQLVLAVVGGGLGGRLGPVGRSRASLVGALVVVALAGVVAVG